MATTYRFYCLWNNGGAISIDEITLHETLAGANIATSATATASSTFGGLVPSNAIDGTGNIWAANEGPSDTCYLQLAFATDVPYLAKVTIKARTGEPNQAPTIFGVYKSQDGGAYELQWHGVQLGAMGGGEVRTYNNPFANGAAYSSTRIKFNVLAVGYGWPCCAELKMYETNGGPNIATNRVMYGGANAAGSRYNVMDGNPGTTWQTSSAVPVFIELLFEPALPYLHSFSWQARPDTSGDEAPSTIEVLSSTNGGSSYEELWTVTGAAGWAIGQTKTFNNPNDPPAVGGRRATAPFSVGLPLSL